MDESGPLDDATTDRWRQAMEGRLDGIEQRLDRIATALEPSQPAGPQPPPPPPPPPPLQSTGEGRRRPDTKNWDSVGTESLLKWTGVGLVVAASAFLVNTAISRGWVQPIHQLLLAIAIGLALAWTAVDWRKTRPRWSQAAAVGSVMVLAVSAGAANRWLNLIDVPPALLASIAVAGFGLFLARRVERASVAALAFAQVLLNPLWLQADQRYDLVWSTVWVLAVVVAATAVARPTSWAAVRTSTVGLLALLLPLVIGDSSVSATGFPWLVQLLLTLIVVVMATPLLLNHPMGNRPPLDDRAQGEQRRLQPQMDLLGAFGLPTLWWVTTTAFWAGDAPNPLSSEWTTQTNYGVIAAAMAGVAALGVGLAVRASTNADLWTQIRHARVPAAMIHGCLTLALIGVGLILPDERFLVVTAAVAAAGLGALGATQSYQLVLGVAAGLALGAGLATLAGLVEGMAEGLTTTAAVSYLVVVALVAAAGVVFRHRLGAAAATTAAVAWSGLLMWLWAVLGQLAQGQMTVSLAYAALGTTAVLAGRKVANGGQIPGAALLPASANQLLGLGLMTLAGTVVKLVTVDLVAVDTLWRSLLFFVVGLGLLRIGLSIQRPDEPNHENGATPATLSSPAS